MKKIKTSKQMERHLKGIANHYRIDILLLLDVRGVLTLEDLIVELNANQKTISEHTRRFYTAGLIDKRYRGRFVEHSLSPYGKIFTKFLKLFQGTR